MSNVTLNLYRTGRLMLLAGTLMEQLIARDNVIEKLGSHELEGLHISSITAVFTFSTTIFNTWTLPQCFINDYELFPASYIKLGYMHLNIFSSGKCVVTGAKSLHDIEYCMEFIDLYINNL